MAKIRKQREPFTAFNLLHRLWTKAVHKDGYDKSEWMALERFVVGAGGKEFAIADMLRRQSQR